ncbi:GIY-YIG nuclease family protein [Mycobacterium sp. E796]|uniref:GIY-YIG nuclease family protein n=1 Tax=Mycobacterium sp. E796 TaxID=1834151 RepID=UPI000800156E|nr:GIY-YIG nuclease family protein [Mycobacterium sp. E796]OBI60631.1 hypothetical protein A5706_17445 [Mycobacterium sp. E796]
MKVPNWRVSAYGRGIESSVPTTTGVYAIVHAVRVHGLATDVQWLYVGQSKNLRRRCNQHTHYQEPNPALENIRNSYDYEFWWATVPAEFLDEVERDLIDHLQPPGNRIRGRRAIA